jgi:acyl-coenzyme A synthetase/AMP-(fatty) acid ligase
MNKIKYIFGDRAVEAATLHELLQVNALQLGGCRRVMVHTDDPLAIALILELAERQGFNLFLCHAFFSRADVRAFADRYGVDTLVNGLFGNNLQVERIRDPLPDDSTSFLHIFTTGTTGEPKLARHSWRAITHAARHASTRLRGKTWLMAYAFTGYAGLQVFFAAQRNEGAICYPASRDFGEIGRAIVQHDVKVISATPTFWRMLINGWPQDLTPPVLEQATLGGEVITQDILDLISRFFRPVGLTHIYASTEAGSVIAVPDRRAGFPAAYLDQARDIGLRIRDGILEIRSPVGMEGYVGTRAGIDPEGWICTGDRVEKRGDRFFFVGRNDSRINVGGLKVTPEEIEEVITGFPEIADCLVYSRPNPIVGAILSADIRLHAGAQIDARQLKVKLQALLPQVKIPQFIRFVEAIEVSENGKKRRN